MEPSIGSMNIAKAIMDDLLDRRGIRQAIEECDDEVREEILHTMASIIEEHIEGDR